MRRRAVKGGEARKGELTLIKQFRELAKGDDGRDYWMINLLKFRDKAVYPVSVMEEMGNDAMKANARYNRAIVPFLLKHGGHPVFMTRVAGRFIRDVSAEDWDQVAAVRYRSRRDMLKMAVDLAGKDIDIHKWAALERTQVFPVKPVLSLLFLRSMVAVILAALGGLAALVT